MPSRGQLLKVCCAPGSPPGWPRAAPFPPARWPRWLAWSPPSSLGMGYCRRPPSVGAYSADMTSLKMKVESGFLPAAFGSMNRALANRAVVMQDRCGFIFLWFLRWSRRFSQTGFLPTPQVGGIHFHLSFFDDATFFFSLSLLPETDVSEVEKMF